MFDSIVRTDQTGKRSRFMAQQFLSLRENIQRSVRRAFAPIATIWNRMEPALAVLAKIGGAIAAAKILCDYVPLLLGAIVHIF
jgi:hypothetical protein